MPALTSQQLAAVHSAADCLYNEEAVELAIANCAAAAAVSLADQQPLVLAVMNGGLSFTDRLLAHWDFPLELDYIHLSRYNGATRAGNQQELALPQTDVIGRHVVVVDDIFDEGLTLAAVVDWLKAAGAGRVTSLVLADKQHQRKQTDYRPDFVALELVDRYVYGYGMDYRGWMRNKRGIYAVAEADL